MSSDDNDVESNDAPIDVFLNSIRLLDGMAVEATSSVGRASAKVSIQRPAPLVIDIGLLGPIESLDLELSRGYGGRGTAHSVRICNVDANMSVGVKLRGGVMRLELEGISGELTFEAEDIAEEVTVGCGPDVTGKVIFGAGRYLVTQADAGELTLAVRDGSELVAGTRLSRLEILGDCALEGTSNVAPTVEVLAVGSGAHSMQLDAASVSVLCSLEESSPGLLTIVGQDRARPTRAVGGSLSVNKIKGVGLGGREGGLPLAVDVSAAQGEITGVTLTGRTDLSVGKYTSISGISAVGTGIKLRASEGAVLFGVSGRWTVSDLRSGQMHGSNDGFELLRLDPLKADGGRPIGVLDGAMLTGFQVSPGLYGRTILAALETAYHVSPMLSDLPGLKAEYRWSRRTFRKRSPDLFRKLPEDAEFVDALARVSKSKGAPGAVRTKMSWCAYRLRHLNTQSFWERVVLFGYRLLGYGERPLPAFATWIVAALLLALLQQDIGLGWGLRSADMPGFGDDFFGHLFAPVSAVVRTSAGDIEYWEYVVRAIPAIPLITGSIALRNFVKQGG